MGRGEEEQILNYLKQMEEKRGTERSCTAGEGGGKRRLEGGRMNVGQ